MIFLVMDRLYETIIHQNRALNFGNFMKIQVCCKRQRIHFNFQHYNAPSTA